MPLLALAAVLLAACTHAIWNLAAKRAAGGKHVVFWYSAVSVVLYAPVIAYLVATNTLTYTWQHWAALAMTSVLHIGYSLLLQGGYRHADLSLVYPLARGSGPLLSFILAVLLLGEPLHTGSVIGMLLIVSGILLVTGLLFSGRTLERKGIWYGIGTGCCLAAYTINDGWAVKTLLISPFIVDYTGNFIRTLVLTPSAWRERTATVAEWGLYKRSILQVSLLGPLGYILVLFAMQLAPVSHVAPARELSTLVGTWLGARLLQEKAAPSRLAGAVCIVTGVVLLALA